MENFYIIIQNIYQAQYFSFQIILKNNRKFTFIKSELLLIQTRVILSALYQIQDRKFKILSKEIPLPSHYGNWLIRKKCYFPISKDKRIKRPNIYYTTHLSKS